LRSAGIGAQFSLARLLKPHNGKTAARRDIAVRLDEIAGRADLLQRQRIERMNGGNLGGVADLLHHGHGQNSL
jgi:hypothetical protein